MISIKKLSPILILFVAIIGSLAPVLETFAAINRTSYQYAVNSCTEGSDLQKERCKDQSAEAMVYRMHKGIKGTDPTNPLYNTWVANLKTGATNSKPLDLAILIAETTTTNNQDYLEDLYQNFLCRTAAQEATAIAQWKSQLDGNKQTRAQIALHLAKRPAAMGCMRAGFLAFLQSNPPVDPDPDPDPVLADASVTCTTQVGQSCSVAAPQYCLSAFVTQPAHGTSTITAGNIVYTPNGNDPTEENYAHLRQNGTATAKCNVKVVFEAPPDNGKRFHITFVGVYFDGALNQSYFQQKLPTYRRVIREASPWNLYQDKIVFHDISAPADSGINCQVQPGVGERSVYCDDAEISTLLAQNGIPADRVIVAINTDQYGGSASSELGGIPAVYADDSVFGGGDRDPIIAGGRFSYFTRGTEGEDGGKPAIGNVMLHEFGHSMGLSDEYIEAGGSPTPNPSYRAAQCMPMDPGPNWRQPEPFSLTWWDEFAAAPEYSSDPAARTNWTQGCHILTIGGVQALAA